MILTDKKRAAAVSTAIGLLAAAVFLAFGYKYVKAVDSKNIVGMKTVVVIDAGHGDFDPGAVASDKTLEKDINLAIALKLRDIFSLNGYDVIMTRDNDITLADKDAASTVERKKTDTHNRTKLADSFNDAVLISIHQNTFSDTSQHGTQVFYGMLNDSSRVLATCIMESVVDKIQINNKRQIKEGTSSIYILKSTKAPTVLVECGFMTNKKELEKLKNNEYQKQLAFCIYQGYKNYEK
ncbi:MAG: N-acetylmuramoyl-L-alanine amidase [Oscillospiraceae bacterium]